MKITIDGMAARFWLAEHQVALALRAQILELEQKLQSRHADAILAVGEEVGTLVPTGARWRPCSDGSVVFEWPDEEDPALTAQSRLQDGAGE